MKEIHMRIDDELLDEIEVYMDKTNTKTYAGAIEKLIVLGIRKFYNAVDADIKTKLNTIIKETKYNSDLLMALIKDQK